MDCLSDWAGDSVDKIAQTAAIPAMLPFQLIQHPLPNLEVVAVAFSGGGQIPEVIRSLRFVRHNFMVWDNRHVQEQEPVLPLMD
jgi:hypothetical protein